MNETQPEQRQCGFCYPSEHGRNGQVKREWSDEWGMFIPLCRKHAQENDTLNAEIIKKRDDAIEKFKKDDIHTTVNKGK